MKVEILVGMIASGKSSYAKMRAMQGAIIINDDAIITSLHGGQYHLYDKRLKSLYKAVEESIFAAAIALDCDVIVDRGLNVSERSRRRWVGLAHSRDVNIVAVTFPKSDPVEHAERRFKHDPRGRTQSYWLKVATEHASQYEPPGSTEGFSDLIYAE